MNQNMVENYMKKLLPNISNECIPLNIIQNLSLNLFDNNGYRYEYPVLGFECEHQQKPFELMVVAQKFSEGKSFECPVCHKEIKNPSDIRKIYLFTIAYEIFNEKTQTISILAGILMTQYRRTKRVTNYLIQEINQKFIKSLFTRKNQKNNISVIIKEDKKFQQNKKRMIDFEVVCLQDFVKLVIPVRHKDCKHIACYDISSLLIQWQEIQLNNQGNSFKLIPCNEDGCYSMFDFNTLESFENELVLDEELFNCINKGYPGVTKFVFDTQNKRICDVITLNNNVDSYIQQIYKELNLDAQFPSYTKFQESICKQFQEVMDKDLNETTKNQKQIYKYQSLNLSLKEDFREGLTIQYPSRCVKCEKIDKFWDLRRFIILIKQQKELGKTEIQCPLCNSTISIKSLDKIYLDYDLMYRIHEMNSNSSQIDPYTLRYDGKKYMLQEFIQRHKITINHYIQNQDNKEYIVYKSFYSQKGERLKDPLRLIECPEQTRISFNYFYEQYANNKYQIEGLCLCNCQACKTKPLQKLNREIFYDELLAQILNKIPQNTEDQEIQYRIATKEIIYSKLQKNSQQKYPMKETKTKPGNQGFLELMTEEEYNNLFQPQLDAQGQFMYQVTQKTFITYGINTIIKPTGEVINDGQSRMQQMNQGLAMESTNNEWPIEITSMKVTDGEKTMFQSQKRNK